jgi:hypothetical protein
MIFEFIYVYSDFKKNPYDVTSGIMFKSKQVANYQG